MDFHCLWASFVFVTPVYTPAHVQKDEEAPGVAGVRTMEAVASADAVADALEMAEAETKRIAQHER